jgi:hypothetical protein
MEKNSQLSEYEEFLKKVFPDCRYNKEYDLLYKRVCSFNIFIEILKKYINDEKVEFFISKITYGYNMLLMYVPLNDSLGITACMRYITEQTLKCFYSYIFKDKSIKEINETSYRHIKDDIKSKYTDKDCLNILYSQYAKYSNEVHDKLKLENKEIEYIYDILSGENIMIEKINKDINILMKILFIFLINNYEIKYELFSLSQRTNYEKVFSNKFHDEFDKLLEC